MNLSRLISISAAGLAVCAWPLLASAQVAPDAISGVAAGASIAARDASIARQKHDAQVAQGTQGAAPRAPAAGETALPEITDADVSKPGFLGDRFTYEADLSSMYQGGDTRTNNANLPGGFDASLIYKLNRTTRLAANYYQFSAFPLGTDDNIPVVFQGTTTPIGFVNGAQAGIDATTHLRFQVYDIQKMFFVGGRHHPLVIAPTYASVRSIIAGKDDGGTIFDQGKIMTVHQRSLETKGLNLVIPLFYAENYLISYTGGAQWNVNAEGANQTNHAQYGQSLYTQYTPDELTTFFASYAKSITYFPTEQYPYNVPTLHMGIARTIKKPFFFEAEVSSGGPSNPNYFGDPGRIGVVNLTVPCPRTAAGGAPTLTCVALAQNGVVVPEVGAQRYTTFTLMIGIGAAPLVRPF